MENVFAGMQVCGYVGVAAAAPAAVCVCVCVCVCVFFVCLWATVDSWVAFPRFTVSELQFPGHFVFSFFWEMSDIMKPVEYLSL